MQVLLTPWPEEINLQQDGNLVPNAGRTQTNR
jgi:hypothetical protein